MSEACEQASSVSAQNRTSPTYCSTTALELLKFCKSHDNRMGNTGDLFNKIGDTKGTFHAKMGSIKDRNGMDLTEAEDIKKRWQEYTEELYKKNLHDPDNHDDALTHLESESWNVKSSGP